MPGETLEFACGGHCGRGIADERSATAMCGGGYPRTQPGRALLEVPNFLRISAVALFLRRCAFLGTDAHSGEDQVGRAFPEARLRVLSKLSAAPSARARSYSSWPRWARTWPRLSWR